MRIQKLEIPTFGPFSNLKLEFPKTDHDLHVIYGLNEAGKSSLLRAIRDLLFGIDSRSSDCFLHDYKSLRIIGEISNKAGRKLFFQRRKGNKDTLLNRQGGPMADGALEPFLGKVDEGYFSTMFGLGAAGLRDGAEELLSAEGRIGTALFSASTGTPIQTVIDALEEEAGRLFRGKATNGTTILPTIGKYRQMLEDSEKSIVSAKEWAKVEDGLAEAAKKKWQLKEENDREQRDVGWFDLCAKAWPTLKKLDEIEQRLKALPTLPTVAADFVARAKAARSAVAGAGARVDGFQYHLDASKREQAKKCPKPEILALATDIEELHTGLGVYKNRRQERDRLTANVAEKGRSIQTGMKNLGLSGEFTVLEGLRVDSPTRLAVRQAAARYLEAQKEQAENLRKLGELDGQIKRIKEDLEGLPTFDLQALGPALQEARLIDGLARGLLAREAEARKLTREVADQHRLLPGAPGDFDATSRLPVPGIAVIREHQRLLKEANDRIANKENDLARIGDQEKAVRAELQRLQRQGELPTEDALKKAREQRDHGWGLVLAEWKGSGAIGEELTPGVPLETAFPQTIRKADEIADQLRLEAEAVAQAEEKRAQLAQLASDAERGLALKSQLEAELSRREAAWQAEWAGCGLNPRSPNQMEEWRNEWDKFRELHRKQRLAEEQLLKDRESVNKAGAALALALAQPEGSSFLHLLSSAEQKQKDVHGAQGRRQQLNANLKAENDKLQAALGDSASLTARLQQLLDAWVVQCQAVKLSGQDSPETVLDLLEERGQLIATYDDWGTQSQSLEEAAGAVGKYERAAADLARKMNIQHPTPEAIESTAWAALVDNRGLKAEHEQLAGQIKNQQGDLDRAKLAQSHADEELRSILDSAGLQNPADLEPLLGNLEVRAEQIKMRGIQNENLMNHCVGVDPGKFIEQVRHEPEGTLASRKRALKERIDARTVDLEEWADKFRELDAKKREFERAGGKAADFRQQAESMAAQLKEDAARFVRIRMAIHHLQGHIDTFREQNQAPLLDKSGEVFSAITLGSFTGLGAESGEDDQPVLVGIRPDGTQVAMDGLSDGSRDQLYLSLRLAALESYIKEHEPMPLILDDLLITFDDARAGAILAQLDKLSTRTQIFLFTHHQHLVDLCVGKLGQEGFSLHVLQSSTPPVAGLNKA